jgi:hypothetical protein
VAALSYDVAYIEERNRLTTAFRYILAIPHLFVVGVWGWFAELLSVIQWFIVVFTGKRNEGIWRMQWGWLAYASRVNGYVELLFDPYPPFGTETGPVPASTALAYEEPADRLTNGLRFIWVIPALFISAGLAIAAFFVLIAAWFAILFTGRHPRGMFDFVLRAMRYFLQTNSYYFLMTDTYPSWSVASAPTGTLPSAGLPQVMPPSPPVGTIAPPPPPPPPQPTAPAETAPAETAPSETAPPAPPT